MNRSPFLVAVSILTLSTNFGLSFSSATAAEEGMLRIQANGEDFVRQGFVSKDGWQLHFERLWVTLADITAYQSDPPFDPDETEFPQAEIEVSIPGRETIDLATGNATVEPVLVGERQAPSGRYNALSWRMVRAESGPASGFVMVLVGTAEKEGITVPFTLRFDREYAYLCGDYLGDERKGILEPGGVTELEATFHFDHIFGDGSLAADDGANRDALGFQPLVDLAVDNVLEVDLSTLVSSLSPEHYTLLSEALAGLAHVGEGHCRETTSAFVR